MKKIIFFASIVLILSSCATGPDLSNPKVRDAISRVQILDSKDLTTRPFDKIGVVQAKSCTANGASSAHSSDEGVKADMKYQASTLNGDAITNYMCQSAGLDMGTNCWNSNVCYADVIKFKK